MVEFVIELIDEIIGTERFLLVGESWGGYLARGCRRPPAAAGRRARPALPDGRPRARRARRPGASDAGRGARCPRRRAADRCRDVFAARRSSSTTGPWDYYRDDGPARRSRPATRRRSRGSRPPTRSPRTATDRRAVRPPEPDPRPAARMRVVGYRDAYGLLERFPHATFATLDEAGHTHGRAPGAVDRARQRLARPRRARTPEPRLVGSAGRGHVRASARRSSASSIAQIASGRTYMRRPEVAGRVVCLGRPEPQAALVGDRGRTRAVDQPSSTRPRPIMNAARAYVVPTQTSADCSLDASTVPSGRIPLTAPIRPPAKPHTLGRWIVCSAVSTRSRGQQVAEAGRVGVPLAAQLVGHDAVRALPAAVVVGVVVATPQPPVEGDLAALEPARSSAGPPRSCPGGVAIASAAARAPSQSDPP